MRLWRGMDEVPRDLERSVVTIGVFDGVHRGHQAVLRRAAEYAGELDAPVAAVTFAPHPDTVVRGLPEPAVLTPAERRNDLLAQHGVDAVCALRFTPELSRMGAEEFVERVLVDRLRAAAVVVGADFRFGRGAAGDVAALRTLGKRHDFAVEGVEVATEPAGGGETITSTLIRRAVGAGDVARARAGLGRPHRVAGVVVPGASRGRDLLGFPTANLDCPAGIAVPADAVYVGWLLRAHARPGEEARWPALVSVGTNPTFGEGERTVEAYALDRDDLDLYGAEAAVEFAGHVRSQERFDRLPDLIEAMKGDVRAAREFMVGS